MFNLQLNVYAICALNCIVTDIRPICGITSVRCSAKHTKNIITANTEPNLYC